MKEEITAKVTTSSKPSPKTNHLSKAAKYIKP